MKKIKDRYLIGMEKVSSGMWGQKDAFVRTFTLTEALKEKKKMPFEPVAVYKLVKVGLIVWTMLFSSNAFAQGSPMKEAEVVRAILGEARGSGYHGMYAVACAIRNRGHLRGVYGKDAFMPDVTSELWHEAARAWFSSEFEGDVTKGADHWFSKADLKSFETSPPAWFKNLEPTVEIGGNTFYKEKEA